MANVVSLWVQTAADDPRSQGRHRPQTLHKRARRLHMPARLQCLHGRILEYAHVRVERLARRRHAQRANRRKNERTDNDTHGDAKKHRADDRFGGLNAGCRAAARTNAHMRKRGRMRT